MTKYKAKPQKIGVVSTESYFLLKKALDQLVPAREGYRLGIREWLLKYGQNGDQ